MVKPIEFEYKGNAYKLEFNRNAIRKMERNGFVIGDIANRPVTMVPELFAGAFIMHHPYLKRPVIDEIFEHMTKREKLMERLGALYSAPIEVMMDEPEEDAGNVIWED